MPNTEQTEPMSNLQSTIDPVDQVPTSSTVILFDWDDTLCPSFHLSSKGFQLSTPITCRDTELGLKAIETAVSNLLELAFTYGEVHIVTNAEEGWVQLSASKFIPGVLPLLSRAKIVSARTRYEKMFQDSPFKWKYFAFKDNLAMVSSNSKVQKNILSFGDSQFEREAIRCVTRELSNVKTKSVKFKERPSLEQLRNQIELIINCFHFIHNHDGDLDLQLTITVHDGEGNVQDESEVPALDHINSDETTTNPPTTTDFASA